MTDIMTLVHDDAGQESRLQVSFDLARALDAHLVCLDVTALPVMPVDFMAASDQAVAVMAAEEQERAHRARMEPRLIDEGVSHEWLARHGDMEDVIVRSARLVDLIVVSGGQDSGDAPGHSDLGARVAERSHVPVLVVPKDQRSLDITAPVLVAWDGSHVSAAAIRAATPLLRKSAEVITLTIGGDEALADASEAAAYLARKGCRVTARPVVADSSIGDIIIAEAKARNAAYVVMGSYGRGRWRERLFGGTSRDLMETLPFPLLIAH